MDMKKILQAFDGASDQKPVEGSSDMKNFMSIVEGKGPLNRLTQAESIAILHQSENKKTITNPVLNVPKDAKPSMIGKYFKTIEEEIIRESSKELITRKEKASDLAERVKYRMYHGRNGQLGHHMKQSHGMHPDIIKSGSHGAANYLARESSDKVDTVSVDIPLLIRLLEYAREDANDDMDLHNIAEKLIELSKDGPLSMDDYESIVGNLDEAHGNSKIYDKCWTGYKKVPGKKRGEPGSCEKK